MVKYNNSNGDVAFSLPVSERTNEMNLHLLEIFCSVVQTGSFTQSAETLHISRPAISAQMHSLESQMGCKLLEKQMGRWVLTEAGKILYAHATAVMSHSSQATAEIEALKRGRQPLVVGVSPGGSLYIVADAIQTFRSTNPGIELQIDVDTPEALFRKTQEGIIKLNFTWKSEPTHRFSTFSVCRCPFFPLVGNSHPLARERAVSASRYNQETLYLYQYGSGWFSPVKQHLMSHGQWLAPSVDLPMVDAVKTLVKAGCGTTILSYAAIQDEIRHEQLAIVDLVDFEFERDLLAIWDLHRKLSLAEESFLQIVHAASVPYCHQVS